MEKLTSLDSQVNNFEEIPTKWEYHDKHRTKRRRRNARACFYAIVLLLVACIVGTAIVWTYYTLKSENNQLRREFDQQRKEFEELRHNCVQNAKNPTYEKQIKKHSERSADRPNQDGAPGRTVHHHGGNEPREQQLAHHGIPASNLIRLTATPDMLKRFNKTDTTDDRNFHRSAQFDQVCRNAMVNHHGTGDVWCPEYDRFIFRGGSRRAYIYKYFQPEPWVNTSASYETYELFSNGKVKVKSSGMYMIYGAITFEDKDGTMKIIKQKNDNDEEEILADCSISNAAANVDKTSSFLPCTAFAIASLKQNDRLYLDIRDFVAFRIDDDYFHFTIIKLNDFNDSFR